MFSLYDSRVVNYYCRPFMILNTVIFNTISGVNIIMVLSCGQSYKTITLINYDSRVVIWGIFKSGTTLES